MKIEFIVGTGRCGSSLVHEIVAKHSDVAFISNIDDNLAMLDIKGRFNSVIYRSAIGNYTKKGRLRFAPSEAYKLIRQRVSPIYERSNRDLVADDVTPWLKSRFESFFMERFQQQHKQVFVHKYTGWSRMGFFNAIFPQARFINIVRDGRAVASSWLQMSWWDGYQGPENWLWGLLTDQYREEWLESDRSYVVLAGVCWKLLLDAFEAAAATLEPSVYRWHRYEDFLDDPEAFMRRLLKELELPWDRDFERRLQAQKISKGRLRAFEKDLTSEQLRQLENSLGEKLHLYGYS